MSVAVGCARTFRIGAGADGRPGAALGAWGRVDIAPRRLCTKGTARPMGTQRARRRSLLSRLDPPFPPLTCLFPRAGDGNRTRMTSLEDWFTAPWPPPPLRKIPVQRHQRQPLVPVWDRQVPPLVTVELQCRAKRSTSPPSQESAPLVGRGYSEGPPPRRLLFRRGGQSSLRGRRLRKPETLGS
jgi:hypothetical protein